MVQMPCILAAQDRTGVSPFGLDACKESAQKAWARKQDEMKLVLKGIAVLVILGALGLAGFAYLADLPPEQSLITKPVVLDGN